MMNLKNIKAIILNILIYIFLPTFITYILAKFNYPHHKLFLNFYNLIPAIITLIIMLKLNKDLFIDKKKDWQKNYSHYLILMVKYYICGFILMNLSSQILIFITKSIPLNEMENREIIATYPIYAILNAGIIGPICEEIAFRGTFKRIIQNKKIYVLLTGFIFGLAHVIFSLDLINIFPYMALGLFLGLIYYETDNLYCSIIVHMFHNLLCLLILLI